MSDPAPVTAKKRGGPIKGSDRVVTLRVPESILTDLDAYAASESAGRSAAVRYILADWLRTHGFSSHNHPKPIGPATDAVEAMDQAIQGDRKRKGSRSAPSGQRLASIKETGEEVPQEEWERFEATGKKPGE